MKYYVRKSWEDEESQIGEYADLKDAQKNLEPDYTIYDSNGQSLISCARLTKPKIIRSNYPKMWEDLRNHFQTELEDLKRLIQNGAHGYGIEDAVEWYEGFLYKMKEVENDNTQIFK